MNATLHGRTVLVTGGGSGIGEKVAEAVVRVGARVVIIGRSADRLATAAERIAAAAGDSQAVRWLAADVTDEDDIGDAIKTATNEAGGLHGVVHCAGGSESVGPIPQLDAAAWRRTIDLNVNGTMYVLKHAGRQMVRCGGGSFVAISSIAASNTHRWFGAYGVSKSAVDHMVKLAADELGASWVRVNGIRPGLTRTELVSAVLSSPTVSEDYRVNTPLPRIGEVDDIAQLALFLLSDASSWITGQVINVDGGQHLRRGPDYSSMFEPIFGEAGLRGVVPVGD